MPKGTASLSDAQTPNATRPKTMPKGTASLSDAQTPNATRPKTTSRARAQRANSSQCARSALAPSSIRVIGHPAAADLVQRHRVRGDVEGESAGAVVEQRGQGRRAGHAAGPPLGIPT